jgi:drug/metabolite transporter (DMT)-like permease
VSSFSFTGALMVAAGAVMLASKGLFAKALYAQGLDHHAVAAARSVLAIPGFIAIAWWSRGASRDLPWSLREVIIAMLAGLLCYYIGSLANFYALTLIDAGVERAILFSYPAMVVLLELLVGRQRPGRTTLAALLATSVGVVLVTGMASRSISSDELAGVLWILFCSATIAIYFLLSARLTRRMGTGRFTMVAQTAAGLGFLCHYQLHDGWLELSLPGSSLYLLLAMVVVATVLPLYLISEGVRQVGASRAAIISTLGPPATAIMAYSLLGEVMTSTQVAGLVLIILAVASLERRKQISTA